MNLSSLPTRKLVLFAALSVADFALTWHLISGSEGVVYEANPIAAWWLTRYGWVGLAIFKAIVAGIATALCLVVWINRPRVGHRVLTFACATVGAVVLYSSVLACRAEARTTVVTEQEMESRLRQLDHAFSTSQTYREVVAQASRDLVAGRCSLDEAVERLWETDKASERQWRQMLHRLYGLDDRSCLAASLVQYTLQQKPRDRQLAKRLRQELTDYCGVDLMAEGGQLRGFAERTLARRPEARPPADRSRGTQQVDGNHSIDFE